MRKRTKLLIFAAAIIMTAAVIIYANISHCAHAAIPVKSDAIIVLGCKANGETPSLLLEYRLSRALELYNSGFGKSIIVSGGQGPKEIFTEALVMRKWLLSHNVPEAAIIEENRSTSTFENLKYTQQIMAEKNLKTAVIVTNDFHIFRALFLADRLGLESTGSPAPDVGYLRFYSRSREVISVVKSFLFDK